MGTHPIFESDFDCLTDWILYGSKMPETKKPEEKAKREEFRRYLDQAGLVDTLTQFLVNLYEEPEKPTDAISYMKKALAQGPDAADVESLKVELEKVKQQLSEMTTRAETAEALVVELQGKLESSETESPKEEEPKAE